MSRTSGSGGLTRRRFLGMAGVGAAAAGGAAWFTLADHETPFQAKRVRRPSRPPNVLVVLGDDLGWGDLSSYGAPTIRTPTPRRARGVRGPVHRRLRRLLGLLADPVRPLHRPLPGSPRRRPAGTDRGPDPGRRHPARPAHPGQPAQGGRLPDRPAREVALRLPALVQPDPGRLGRVLRQLLRRPRLLLQCQPRRRARPLRGRGRGRRPALLHRHPHRARRRLRHSRARQALAAQPQLHDSALAVGGPRGPSRQRRDLTARTLAGDGARARPPRRRLARRVPDHGREPRLAPSARCSTRWRSSGQRKDTVVLFASDNGGERFSYMWPFSGEKASLQEGGIRVPDRLVSWPGTLPGGQVSHAPVITMDWTATLLDLAGALPAPPTRSTARASAGYLLDGEPHRHRDLFWRMQGQGALRRGDLKYPAGRQ